MSYLCSEPKTIWIADAINKVISGKWILAPFQRPPAWGWKEQEALLVSLFKGIPIGVIYLWKHNPVNVHLAFREVPGITFDNQKVEHLIIDGQQRLSFLAWLKLRSNDDQFLYGPGLVYFNASEGSFSRSLKEDKPNGIIVVNSFMDASYKAEVEKELKDNKINLKNYTEILENIGQLHNAIVGRKIIYQELNEQATIAESFMVYEKVNEGGKVLKGDDYAEAALFSLHPKLHTLIHEEVKNLSNHALSSTLFPFKRIFNRSNFIRCILDELYHNHNPNSKKNYPISLLMDFYQPRYFNFQTGKEANLTTRVLENAFKKVKIGFEILKRILTDDLHILDDSGINPTFCVPLNTYLRTKGVKINQVEKGFVIKWLILFHIQSKPYIGSQDVKIKNDCKAARELNNAELLKQLQKNIGGNSLEFTKENIFRRFGKPGNKPTTQSYFLSHLQLFIAINNSATDWFEYTLIENVKRFELHRHHIFPQSYFNDKQKYVQDYIGNIARIIKRTNSSIKNKLPDHKYYLPEIVIRNPDALIAQHIPVTNQKLWKFTPKGLGKKMMEERVKTLALEINQFIKRCDDGTWMNKQMLKTRPTTQEMLTLPESQDLEFKESMLWMIKQNVGSKDFAYTLSKEIAGFMNNGGGNLFIGVKDNQADPNRVIGLDRDFKWIENEYPGSNVEEKFEEIFLNRVKQDLTKKNFDKIIKREFITVGNVKIYHILVPHIGDVEIRKFKEYSDSTKKFETIKDVYFVRRVSSVTKDRYIDSKGVLRSSD